MNHKLEIVRGDSHTIDVLLQDELQQAIDITGVQVFFTARLMSQVEDGSDTTAQIHKYTSDHTDPTNGKTSFDLGPSDTGVVGVYYWDIQLKYADGVINSTLRGKLEIVQDVTKTT